MKKIIFAILMLCMLAGCSGNTSGSSLKDSSKEVYKDLNDDIALTARYYERKSEATIEIKFKNKTDKNIKEVQAIVGLYDKNGDRSQEYAASVSSLDAGTGAWISGMFPSGLSMDDFSSLKASRLYVQFTDGSDYKIEFDNKPEIKKEEMNLVENPYK